MSLKAFQKNCIECEAYWMLRSGKLEMENRPCPTLGRKQTTPWAVQKNCHTEWVCSNRQPIKAGK